MAPKIFLKEQPTNYNALTSSKHLSGYYFVPDADPGLKLYLERDRMVIGRDEECDLQVDDDSISRVHCMIMVVLGGLKVCDLNSTNGVLVNGMPVQEMFLKVGDTLHVGDFALSVHHNQIRR